jgi:hypothetical protein
MWSALTCQRLLSGDLSPLRSDGRDKSRPKTAATSRRTPHLEPLWSALTCQCFVKRRLVAANRQ